MRALELEVAVTPPLGATLMVPEPAHAAALMIQGSGVHDRDGNMPAVGFQSTLYRRVARELAQRCGLATLRFDKRGHDKPACYPHDYSIAQRLDDARAALALLRGQMPGLPLFLIGHSEGALVAAKLAESETVSGVISLAAPFGNVFELGKDRARRRIAQGQGAAVSKGEQQLAYFDKLHGLFKEGARILPEDFVALAKPYLHQGYEGWESYEWLAGHWAGALQSDPTARGRPMLVVQGGRDARLWADNPQRWQAWCKTRPGADFQVIEHMGHDLNDARKKTFSVDEEVLQAICAWIKR